MQFNFSSFKSSICYSGSYYSKSLVYLSKTRFSILTLSIAVGAVSASPCRPSSSQTSAETTTVIVCYASTSAVPSSTELPIEATTTAFYTESASQTSSEAESTTESTAAATSTAAVAPLCRAPAALQCCNTVGTASSPTVSLLIGLLGIVIQDQSTVVGTTCEFFRLPTALYKTNLYVRFSY